MSVDSFRQTLLMPTPTSTTARPLTAEQTKTLRMIWEMCRANGGSTRLSRQPTALANRGLVKRCDGARHATEDQHANRGPRGSQSADDLAWLRLAT